MSRYQFAVLALSLACAAPAGAQLFPTGRIFDLSLGVDSTYDAASDSILGGTQSSRVGFRTVQDLFDHAQSADLQRINSAYTDNSAAVIRFGYRGLPLVLDTAAHSPAIRLLIPVLGEQRTFGQRATRDDNLDDVREFLKSEGGDLLNRLQQQLVRLSPVDPIAGNPGSLQTQMVNGDFDRTFTQFASNVVQAGGSSSGLVGFGIGFDSFTVGGVRHENVTLPFSYTWRADLDPRRQLTVYAPVTISRVDGATSASAYFGGSYRYPVNDQWAVTPALGYGITGSVDVGSAAAMMAASVSSQYTFSLPGFDLAVGNALGIYRSNRLSARGYSFDPGVRNTVLRNGLLVSRPTELMGQRLAWEVSFINTIYNGTELYSNRYNEIGVTLGTNRSANSARSYLRAGLTFYRGQRDIKGGRLNVGYWF